MRVKLLPAKGGLDLDNAKHYQDPVALRAKVSQNHPMLMGKRFTYTDSVCWAKV